MLVLNNFQDYLALLQDGYVLFENEANFPNNIQNKVYQIQVF